MDHSAIGTHDDHVSKASRQTLHPIRGVVWAAFWGSPIAAGIVMAINYARMGRGNAARITVVAAILATVLLFAIFFALPEDLPVHDLVFYFVQLWAVYLIANALQGKAIQNHLRSGGSVVSAWPSVGIGLICQVVIAIILAPLIFWPEPTVIQFGDDDVQLAGDATEADARKLAEILHE